MLVPVVLVVHVQMGVLHRLVPVLVLVVLSEVQPHAEAHQHAGRQQLDRHRLLQKRQRRNRAQERRRREIRAGASGPEMPKGINEQDEADAVSHKAHHTCHQGRRDAGHLPASKKPESEVHGAGDQALQLDDLQRVGERNLAREIVVKPPRDAGADDGERSQQA
jgi:hypothetical protein